MKPFDHQQRVRRAHLQALCDAKGQRAVALRLGMRSGSWLSQLLSGKTITERTARKVESALRLKSGTLDQA